MITDTKLHLGTTAWFEMVGMLMIEAARNHGLPPELNNSLVERYIDGVELSEGFVQGIRLDILEGNPTFRVGVRPDERADVTIEITIGAARELNSLQSADPNYYAACQRLLSTGEMRVDGNLSQMAGWLNAVHDPIVRRTR